MSGKDLSQFDIVVIGGGMGGVATASMAASQGAKTLIVEQSGLFGGVGTNSLIAHFSQRPLPGAYRKTFWEMLVDRLTAEQSVKGADYNPEQMVLLLDDIVSKSGSTPLFFTSMVDVVTEGRQVKRVKLHNKSGLFEVEARVFIDSTGDGDLCAQAGASYEQGDGSTQFGQPMTLAFFMSQVDGSRMLDRETINRMYDEAKARGEVSNPRENVLSFEAVEPGTYLFNTTRIIHRDGTDGWSLTEATLEGRAQVREMVRFLKTLPGFEKAYLQRMANRIGVRETRRFHCEYRLTEEDMHAGRRFEDGIMITGANIDIHNPHGTGTRYEPLKKGTTYQVPLRCLIPKDLDNVLIGSRCIGTSHEAFSAVRMMGHVAEYGRAAGLTAAWAVKHNRPIREVDVDWVRRQLGTLEEAAPVEEKETARETV